MKDSSIVDPFYLRLQEEINRTEKKSDKFRFFFYGTRICQILLTGSITVLSGIEFNVDQNKVTVLVLGTLATVITALDSLFQTDTKKNTYKTILFELRSIRSEFVQLYISQNGKIENRQLEPLFENYKKAKALARDLIGKDGD